VFTVSGIRTLHSWTHECLTLVLNHLATVPETDFVKGVPGFGFPTLREQIVHIFSCEGFWVHTLQDIRWADRDAANWPDVAHARTLQERVSANTLAYLADVTDEQLNTDTELRFADGDVAFRTPALVLHHVFTHAFHHKGQIVSMCRLLGYPAPDTDLSRSG
jgi:uncharacterized damage-inducible protein DinB